MRVPLNPQLDTLSDYPFEALRTLLNPVTLRVNDPPILMSLGEPQHQPPPLLAATLAANADKWNQYPPMAGTPELRQAIVDWLNRRYRLPAASRRTRSVRDAGRRLRQRCRVPFPVEAVERRRVALRVCRGRPKADRALFASAQLWRLPGAVAGPGGRRRAVAGRGACRGEPRPIPPPNRESPGRNCRAAP